MNSGTRVLAVDGPAGPIDTALDRPAGKSTGIAIVAHPHPKYGGTRDNKVVQTLARALLALGYTVWRPNFRGVGDSAGSYDEGIGETEDVLALVRHARAEAVAGQPQAQLPLVLAGFSFGTYVQTRVARRLREQGDAVHRLVLVGAAASRFPLETVPEDTLVIHGEHDETVPLQSVLDWARPQELPIVVIPGCEHFFHRKLALLKRIVLDTLAPRDDRDRP